MFGADGADPVPPKQLQSDKPGAIGASGSDGSDFSISVFLYENGWSLVINGKGENGGRGQGGGDGRNGGKSSDPFLIVEGCYISETHCEAWSGKRIRVISIRNL